jgi:chromosome segregation ATPase
VSRSDQTDLEKEVVQLRLELHYAKNKSEQLQAVLNYHSIEARDFEAKWLRVLEENEGLRKELQDTREDLDRANEVLAKLFKERA